MALFFLSLTYLFCSSALGVLLFKHNKQIRRDADRKAYVLSFPTDLAADKVVDFFSSISGALRPNGYMFDGKPSLALELWAQATGKTWRLRVPWQYEDFILPQLHARGISATPDDSYPRHHWTHARELRLRHSHRKLRSDQASTALSILSGLQTVAADETVVWQLVVAPARHKPLPSFERAQTSQPSLRQLFSGAQATRHEVTERREKLSEPNFHAVARIAAVASTPIRAQKLVNLVRQGIATLENGHTNFERRFATQATLSERVDRASTAFTWPMELMASELALLVAWPTDSPYIVGMPSYMSRLLPANAMVPQEGRVIGRSNFHGQQRPIALDYQMATTHVLVTAPSGRGKSVLLANMAKQDIEHGHGVIIIETKGGAESLFSRVVNYVPPHRLGDVIILDGKDAVRPVGFNMLQQGDRAVMVDIICDLFDYLYPGDKSSLYARSALKRGLTTLTLEPKATLLDLVALYRPKDEEVAWADDLRRKSSAHNEDMRNFWQDYENRSRLGTERAQDEYIRPLLNRIWPLIESDRIRNIVGQSGSAFQLADVLKTNKILFINLDGIEQQSRFLLATLIINTIWQTVQVNQPDKANFLYLDEFQDVLKLPVGINEMLSQARKYKLGLVLAHQDFSQLTPDVRGSVINGTASKVFFQTNSAEDANIMARTFSPLEAQDFQSFRQYEGAARIATPAGVSQPVTFKAMEPLKGFGTADHIIERSRQVYGRPIAEVHQEISERRRLPEDKQRKRPRMPGVPFTLDDYR